jgi:hypothetical protein
MYELTTNEGKHLIHQKPKNEQMWRYIRAKIALGYKHSEVLFCWSIVQTHKDCERFVAAQEIQVAIKQREGEEKQDA